MVDDSTERCSREQLTDCWRGQNGKSHRSSPIAQLLAGVVICREAPHVLGICAEATGGCLCVNMGRGDRAGGKVTVHTLRAFLGSFLEVKIY